MAEKSFDRGEVLETADRAYDLALDAYARRDAKTGDVYAEITGYLDGKASSMRCSCEEAES